MEFIKSQKLESYTTFTLAEIEILIKDKVENSISKIKEKLEKEGYKSKIDIDMKGLLRENEVKVKITFEKEDNIKV